MKTNAPHYHYSLRWYSRKTGKKIGQTGLDHLDQEILSRVAGLDHLEDWDGCYDLSPDSAEILKLHLNIRIRLDEFDYELGCNIRNR